MVLTLDGAADAAGVAGEWFIQTANGAAWKQVQESDRWVSGKWQLGQSQPCPDGSHGGPVCHISRDPPM